MEQIELIATENYKELADPTLTKNQILIAVNIAQTKKLKENISDEVETDNLPIQNIMGFDIYLN